MRILLLTQWFDPEPTFKGLRFAQELQSHGHDVEVLTGFPNYPEGKIYDGYRVRAYQRDVVDGVVVRRVALYPSHDSSGARRLLNYGSFATSATVAAVLGRRPDVVYVMHPPGTIAMPAMVLRWLRGVPFVYDVHDLWPDTLSATGMVPEGRIIDLVGAVMSAAYRSAAHVVTVSDGIRERLRERGVPGDKLSMIRTWTYEDEITVGDPVVARKTLGIDDTFNVVFAGNMGKAQALDTVLEAAELLRGHPTRFVLLGGGVDVDRLRAAAEARDLDNVVFLPRRPASEVGEVLTAGDALLVHLKVDPLFAITVPSKLQAYLLAGKPVLMGVAGEAATMVDDAGAGRSFPPEDARALADAVLELMGRPAEELAAMGTRGQEYYRNELSLAAGTARYAEVLEDAARTRHRFQRTKRVLDVVGAATALSLLSVPIAALAVAVRVRLGSPVLFKQVRPGRHGKLFTIWKFRTMTDGVDAEGGLLPDAQRLTSFGTFLRLTSLDELPELVNVLRGEMSLVGPRPLLPRYTEFFTREERRRLDVRPGITGLAQVRGRNLATWDERLALDTWYVDHLSPWLDLKIVGATVRGVFRRSGVVADPESVMQNLDDERRGRAGSGATS